MLVENTLGDNMKSIFSTITLIFSLFLSAPSLLDIAVVITVMMIKKNS